MIFAGGGENWTFESDNIETLEVRFFLFPRVDGFCFCFPLFFFLSLFFFYYSGLSLCQGVNLRSSQVSPEPMPFPGHVQ